MSKSEQTNAAKRRENNIRSFKILDIKGDGLIIRNATNKETCVSITVPDPRDYEVGNYVDVIFSRTGTSSFKTEFLGKTPQEFVPQSNIEIY